MKQKPVAKAPSTAAATEQDKLQSFCNTVLQHYHQHGRLLSWRENPSVYEVFISEIMLQQTQVSRVEKKYPAFIADFPDFTCLANASLAEVLTLWQGMGYNRRARYLLESARIIVERYHGALPRTREELRALPGVGEYTSGAILTFAFNIPEVFIETNIRRAFLYHFFSDSDVNSNRVRDSKILPLIELSLGFVDDVRLWYYALMDYGLSLRVKLGRNPNVQSFHYTRQSAFKGSKRELRGKTIKILVAEQKVSYNKLKSILADERVDAVINELKEEGFITDDANTLSIS